MSLLTLTTLQQQQREWNSIYCVICRRWSIHGHDTYTFSRQFHSLTQPRPLPAILYCAMAWNRGWLRQDLISHLPLPAFLLLFLRIHQPRVQEVHVGREEAPNTITMKKSASFSNSDISQPFKSLCIYIGDLPSTSRLIVVSEIKRTLPLYTLVIQLNHFLAMHTRYLYSSL